MGYIHWDPDPVLFYLPYINKPIVWYGVLFALGFYFSYRLFSRLVTEHFCRHLSLRVEDVSCFSRLVMTLQKTQDPFLLEFVSSCSLSTQAFIKGWTLETPIEDRKKQKLVESMNRFIDSKEYEAIDLVDSRQRKIFSTFKSCNGKHEYPKLKKRLKLEETLYLILKPLNSRVSELVEKVVMYVLIATIVGARLGHILFYESLWYYLRNPLSIVKTWEGGLASHGGVLAIAIATVIFCKRHKHLLYPISKLRLLDYMVVAACVASTFIRIGNFFNQEIIGVTTSLPWGIVFGHPLDGSEALPRHPAQLYEAFFYFSLLIGLYFFRLTTFMSQDGKISALFFVLAFSFRFAVEFIKLDYSVYQVGFVNMGQILSVPVVLFGVYLLKNHKTFSSSS